MCRLLTYDGREVWVEDLIKSEVCRMNLLLNLTLLLDRLKSLIGSRSERFDFDVVSGFIPLIFDLTETFWTLDEQYITAIH
jgi:hypothetical protein